MSRPSLKFNFQIHCIVMQPVAILSVLASPKPIGTVKGFTKHVAGNTWRRVAPNRRDGSYTFGDANTVARGSIDPPFLRSITRDDGSRSIRLARFDGVDSATDQLATRFTERCKSGGGNASGDEARRLRGLAGNSLRTDTSTLHFWLRSRSTRRPSSPSSSHLNATSDPTDGGSAWNAPAHPSERSSALLLLCPFEAGIAGTSSLFFTRVSIGTRATYVKTWHARWKKKHFTESAMKEFPLFLILFSSCPRTSPS